MKVEMYIPDTLSEITLAQYQKYIKYQKDNDDENFLAIKMIEVFCGLRNHTVRSMKAKSIRDICKILTDMFNEKPELVKQFEMKGITYGFVPDLENITFGEYIDLDTFIGDFENMHKAMAVLYRPITQSYKDKYTIEKYTGDKFSDMINMPMDAVFSSILFFYHLGMELSTVMMNSLETQEEEENLVQYLSSIESGDGINQFGVYLDKMLQDLKISLN
jgi:hypothetical protein|tara:strand:+ start:1606 stop:2259 length:654 start_codon:yes stop_codon:yes gene_type:complete